MFSPKPYITIQFLLYLLCIGSLCLLAVFLAISAASNSRLRVSFLLCCSIMICITIILTSASASFLGFGFMDCFPRLAALGLAGGWCWLEPSAPRRCLSCSSVIFSCASRRIFILRFRFRSLTMMPGRRLSSSNSGTALQEPRDPRLLGALGLAQGE